MLAAYGSLLRTTIELEGFTSYRGPRPASPTPTPIRYIL